jgi:hypothetical protein
MKGEFRARRGGKFPGDLRSQCNGCAHGVVSEQGRPRRWARLFIGKFWAAIFSGAALSVASVGIEDEDGTVFAANLDRLAGGGTLVEQVGTRLRIVVGDPCAVVRGNQPVPAATENGRPARQAAPALVVCRPEARLP